jgi:hypothetical protein
MLYRSLFDQMRPSGYTYSTLKLLGLGALLFCYTNMNARNKTVKQALQKSNFKAVETGFLTIPDSVQTSVYWYWISGNISKEGVVKDLEAMKKVGINRAFIGDIGLEDVPYGKVKLLSEEWWDILHTALKTATRLNIEIGIFNSPGWSQSGGPWVKPHQAMRYLTSSQIQVKGPMLFNKILAKPQVDFQDVKVIAYPVSNAYATDISTLKPMLSSVPVLDSLQNLFDHQPETAIYLKRGIQFTLAIQTKQAYTVRSLTINTTRQPFYLEGDVQVLQQGVYQNIKHFKLERSNPALNTGFTPYAAAAISIPATTAKTFRIIFSNISRSAGIAELNLSSVPVVENYAEKSLAKMYPTPQPTWNDYQWEFKGDEPSVFSIDPQKVIDVSAQMSANGQLNWKVPAGNWVIERTGMSPTKVTNAPAAPSGTGLEIDKMSIKHVGAHFDAFMGQILKRIPAQDRKTWKVVVQDSYETGGQNWTDDLIKEFEHTYHYSPVPYLPVLQGKVVGSAERSDRFLWDLRRLIADDVSYKYVAGLREVSHKNGLTTWLENYGHWGFPGEFLQYGGQSDEIGGEFWSEGELGDIENRAASSSAHIYGKTKVSAESFTAAGNPFWRYPAMFKKRGDRFFTEGINNTLLHVYIQQPIETNTSPGMTAWFGVEFNRLNTWFADMDIFLQYIKRSNLLLQQGRYVADVAYFIGEDAPKMTGVADPVLPQGYSFDYINGEVIKTRLTVKNGKLTLPNGISYSILVLPKLETIRPELLAKIKDLVQQGAVVLGPKPKRSPSLQAYPSADQQVQQLAAELWGKVDGISTKLNHYGKGLVISGMNLQEALDEIKVVPDLKVTESDSILFIHRKLVDGELYFVSNQKNIPVKFNTAFRVTGKRPELWDAVSGQQRYLPAYTESGSTTSVAMQLAPFESAFVVFRKEGKPGGSSKANYPLPESTIELDKPWMVSFDPKSRGPLSLVKFDTLTDWSQHTDDSIKYYSGTALYRTTFKMGKIARNTTYSIHLGKVSAIAKVFVNGLEMGGAWTPPYRVNISKALKRGENRLEIKVVNTWVNRLVGDSLLPAEQRKATALVGPDPKKGLEPSGLFGPVKIEGIKYEEIKP